MKNGVRETFDPIDAFEGGGEEGDLEARIILKNDSCSILTDSFTAF